MSSEPFVLYACAQLSIAIIPVKGWRRSPWKITPLIENFENKNYCAIPYPWKYSPISILPCYKLVFSTSQLLTKIQKNWINWLFSPSSRQTFAMYRGTQSNWLRCLQILVIYWFGEGAVASVTRSERRCIRWGRTVSLVRHLRVKRDWKSTSSILSSHEKGRTTISTIRMANSGGFAWHSAQTTASSEAIDGLVPRLVLPNRNIPLVLKFLGPLATFTLNSALI